MRMRPDTQANLQRHLIHYGVAGFTLLTFLLTQLICPQPVSALRVQAGLENNTGISLKEKLLESAPGAGLEETIILEGPNGPIQYQVPTVVKLVIDQLTSKDSASTQEAIHILLSPRPPWRKFDSLLSAHPAFFFWALEHIPDSQTSLEEKLRKQLAVDLIRSMDHSRAFQSRLIRDQSESGTPQEQLDTAIVNLEMWRYLLLRILLIEDRLKQSNRLTELGGKLLADSRKLIAIHLTSMAQGSQIMHPRIFLESWLFQLGVAQPRLGDIIGEFLSQWDDAGLSSESPEDIIYGGFEPWENTGWVSSLPEDEPTNDGVSSARVIGDLAAQRLLMAQLRALQEAIDPRADSMREQAWHDPIHYLTVLAKGKKTVIFKSSMGWEGIRSSQLPNETKFQMSFLDQIGDTSGPLGQENIKKWAIVISYLTFYNLFDWLHKSRIEVTGGMLVQNLQTYLNSREIPIRPFLGLPDREEPVEVTSLLNVFQRLRAIREKDKAEITFFYKGDGSRYSSDGSGKSLVDWLEEHTGDAKLIFDVGNDGTNPGYDVPEGLVGDDSALWIKHRRATEDFPADAEDKSIALARMFPHAAFLIGQSQEWGDFQSSAIPIRQNQSFLQLMEDETFEVIRDIDVRIQISSDQPLDVVVMTSPSEEGEEEEPAVFMPTEDSVTPPHSDKTPAPALVSNSGLESEDKQGRTGDKDEQETRREFLINAQQRLMAIRAILQGDVLGPIAQILGQSGAVDLKQLEGFVGIFEYFVNLERMEGISEEVGELSKEAELASQNVLDAPVVERGKVGHAWLVLERLLTDFEKSGDTATLSENAKQTLALFQRLATATPDAQESTMRETTQLLQHIIQEELDFWKQHQEGEETGSLLYAFRLPTHVHLRKWLQIVTREDHDKFDKQRVQYLGQLRAQVERLAALPPRQQFPIFQMGLRHAIEQVGDLANSSQEKLTVAAEVLERLKVTLPTLPIRRLSERMREGWHIPEDVKARGESAVEEYIQRIERIEREEGYDLFPSGFTGKFIGLEPFRTESAPPSLLQNDFQDTRDLSRRQKPTVTLSFEQKSLPPGWDPVTEAEMVAWTEVINGHKGHLAIVLGAVPKGHPGLPRLAKVAQRLHEEFPNANVSFFYTDQEALFPYRNERKLYLPAFRAWAGNLQGGLHAIPFNELAGLSMLDEFGDAFSAGLEEAGLARAMADSEVLGILAQQGWAKVSGGYVAEADLSMAEPLVLQKGLQQPEGLPKEVPVVRADETTLVGMIRFLKELALQGGFNVAFSTEYFDLKEAQAALPLTQPMPGSVLLAPGIQVQAKELEAAFVISKRTGTIYVIRIVEFTSPNWKTPLLYIRVQA